PRPVHRLHVERLRNPGAAVALLRARGGPGALPLPEVRPRGDPGLRGREDAADRRGQGPDRHLAGGRGLDAARLDPRLDAPSRAAAAAGTGAYSGKSAESELRTH